VKLIVCEECESEFKITHSMDEHHYQITYCPFQFETDCLLKPDEYYNAFIGCKISRSHLLIKS
jgi:hypothetical protein